MSRFPDNYIDMIFADPPYMLSNDGFSCPVGRNVPKSSAEFLFSRCVSCSLNSTSSKKTNQSKNFPLARINSIGAAMLGLKSGAFVMHNQRLRLSKLRGT